MATHSSILARETPWTEEPGGLQSMGSQRFRHDRSDLAQIHVATGSQTPEKWQPEIWQVRFRKRHSVTSQSTDQRTPAPSLTPSLQTLP